MVAVIDIDALKIYEQLRLKISKKLRTTINLDSKFTSFYKKKFSLLYLIKTETMWCALRRIQIYSCEF